jgi:transcriptional regulator with GAF, ATPase, and Fis domain
MDASPTQTADSRSWISLRGARLVVTRGPDTGRAVAIESPSFVVGTGETADLRLTDPSVSRQHLFISLQPKGVRIRDANSKNGTWLGGVRIADALLTSDASLVLGETALNIVLEAPLELPLSASTTFGGAIGVSPPMRHLFATLERLAGTDLTVLFEGESGTGKDLLARALHARSTRADAPMVVVDCSALPPQLVESELFGHERGAFTGADAERAGAFAAADGGTIFLDEVGDLPLDIQPKLLRAIEAREIRPVGGRRSFKIDVRVIAATSKRLAEAVVLGEFRSDLFYRLAVARISVPPLRDRPNDILPLARAILRMITGNAAATLPPDLESILESHDWPGNVRELRNVLERWVTFGKVGSLAADDVEEAPLLPYFEARKMLVERFEERYVPLVMARANGVVTRAAEIAQVARPSFYRMLERTKKIASDRPPK